MRESEDMGQHFEQECSSQNKLQNNLVDLHKFVLFHLMDNLPFYLPQTIYINIPRNLKGLASLDDIYYVALTNKLRWDQGVYHIFNKMDEDFKHTHPNNQGLSCC